MTDIALIETRKARLALASAAKRSADLIQSVDNMDLPLPGFEWTVGDTAAHLIFALRGFTDSARDDLGEWQHVADLLPPTSGTSQRIAHMNRVLIPAEPKRSPRDAAGAITDGADAFLAATADLSPRHAIATPWYGDTDSLTVAEATCLLLGEQVIHGYDIAKAARGTWRIAASDAYLILEAVHAMMPKMAKPEALRDISATYRIHLGGPGGFVVRCADGAITVEAPAEQRIDCHVAADPVAFMLLGYGRVSQWRAIGRAKMITWGRKPWLAFRFASFMSHP